MKLGKSTRIHAWINYHKYIHTALEHITYQLWQSQFSGEGGLVGGKVNQLHCQVLHCSILLSYTSQQRSGHTRTELHIFNHQFITMLPYQHSKGNAHLSMKFHRVMRKALTILHGSTAFSHAPGSISPQYRLGFLSVRWA